MRQPLVWPKADSFLYQKIQDNHLSFMLENSIEWHLHFTSLVCYFAKNELEYAIHTDSKRIQLLNQHVSLQSFSLSNLGMNQSMMPLQEWIPMMTASFCHFISLFKFYQLQGPFKLILLMLRFLSVEQTYWTAEVASWHFASIEYWISLNSFVFVEIQIWQQLQSIALVYSTWAFFQSQTAVFGNLG